MFKFKQNTILENIVGTIFLIVGIRLTMPSWYVMLHGPLNLLWFVGEIVCFVSALCIFVDIDKLTDYFICENSLNDDDDDDDDDDEEDE